MSEWSEDNVFTGLCVCASDSWGVNCYAKTVQATDFNFDKRVSRSVRTWSLKIFWKGAWPGSRDTQNFQALNTYSSNTVKATDFKFDKRFQGQSEHDP